jgi:DNA-binding beta-propeller fold protein YncE
VLHLSAFVAPDQVVAVCDALASADGVSHVAAGARTTEGLVSVSAEVQAASTEAGDDVYVADTFNHRVQKFDSAR